MSLREPTPQAFQIFERHYKIITDQVIANFPNECGGFVGGRDGMIKAIFPVANQTFGNRNDQFTITTDDIMRAHTFFEKYGLIFYGVYHSHPNGIPEPSIQDLKTRNRYHFIVGYSPPRRPIFAAFEAIGLAATAIPIDVLPDDGITPVDIQAPINPAGSGLPQKLAHPDPFYPSGFSTIV